MMTSDEWLALSRETDETFRARYTGRPMTLAHFSRIKSAGVALGGMLTARTSEGLAKWRSHYEQVMEEVRKEEP